jgi:hypothetical protein
MRLCFTLCGSSSISVGVGQAASLNPLKSFDEPAASASNWIEEVVFPDVPTFPGVYLSLWMMAATQIEEDPRKSRQTHLMRESSSISVQTDASLWVQRAVSAH